MRWAVGIALVFTVGSRWLPANELGISTLSALALTYAALSFGACVTGAVLALTKGDAAQRKEWASDGPSDTGFSHFSELVFVFTWAALSQIAVVIAAAMGLLLGGNLHVWPEGAWPTHIALLAVSYAIAAYAVMELITVILTISQLGVVTDQRARRPD